MKPETEHEIVEMHDSGMKITAIAAEMAISVTAVRRVLKKFDRDLTVVKPLRDEETIVNQYVQNIPIPEILKEHELTYSMLYGILNKHQVPVRKIANAVNRQVQYDLAVEMYKDGAPLWQITAETGIAQPALHSELHKRGVTLRRAFTRAGQTSILSSDEDSTLPTNGG